MPQVLKPCTAITLVVGMIGSTWWPSMPPTGLHSVARRRYCKLEADEGEDD
jgi:hypothetical protein